jgi:plastocyanin
MNPSLITLLLTSAAILAGCATSGHEGMKEMSKEEKESYFMPNATASRIVTVTTGTNGGPVTANILIQTHAVVTRESGARETLARFGEVYAFSPNFITVYRDEPTLIRFWNLQGDDNHDFMLIDPHSTVLMKALLPPLQETSFIFTFHEEGLYNFVCAMHQPAMNGQILVLPPRNP